MEKNDPCVVTFSDNDILWAIHVVPSSRIEYNEPVCELQWGWAAGMTKEERESIDQDFNRYNSIPLMRREAIALKEKLDAWITQTNQVPGVEMGESQTIHKQT